MYMMHAPAVAGNGTIQQGPYLQQSQPGMMFVGMPHHQQQQQQQQIHYPNFPSMPPIANTAPSGLLQTQILQTTATATNTTTQSRGAQPQKLCDQQPPEVWGSKEITDAVANAPGCARCGEPFGTLFKRKHPCRCCGRNYCDTCSSHRAELKHFKLTNARVCDHCHLHLGTRHDTQCLLRLIPFVQHYDKVASRTLKIQALQEMHMLLGKEGGSGEVDKLRLIPPLLSVIHSSSPALALRPADGDAFIQSLALKAFAAAAARSDGATSLKKALVEDSAVGEAAMLAIVTSLATPVAIDNNNNRHSSYEYNSGSVSDDLVDSLAVKEEAARVLSALAMHASLKPLLLQHNVHQPLINELGNTYSYRHAYQQPPVAVVQRLKGIQEAAAVTLFYLSHAQQRDGGSLGSVDVSPQPQPQQQSQPQSASATAASATAGLGELAPLSASHLVRAFIAELEDSRSLASFDGSLLQFIAAILAAVVSFNGALK
jgi:hypothetical protein